MTYKLWYGFWWMPYERNLRDRLKPLMKKPRHRFAQIFIWAPNMKEARRLMSSSQEGKNNAGRMLSIRTRPVLVTTHEP